jgi:hypothetical protein
VSCATSWAIEAIDAAAGQAAGPRVDAGAAARGAGRSPDRGRSPSTLDATDVTLRRRLIAVPPAWSATPEHRPCACHPATAAPRDPRPPPRPPCDALTTGPTPPTPELEPRTRRDRGINRARTPKTTRVQIRNNPEDQPHELLADSGLSRDDFRAAARCRTQVWPGVVGPAGGSS